MVRLQGTCFSEKIIYLVTFLFSQGLFFVPKKVLKKIIISKLSTDIKLEAKFFLSGRSALRSIGDNLHKNYHYNILIPDYLCNVVQSALEASECQCSSYPLGEDLEPNIEFLKQSIKSGRYSAVVVAPIFGSQCGLVWWSSSEAIKLAEANEVTLIFDFCQDISLEKKYNMLGLYSNAYVVYSFNDKSIPGVMGALVIGHNLSVLKQEKISIKKSIMLRLVGLLKLINYFFRKRKNGNDKYDYSYCKNFPYLNTAMSISNYQLLVALIGLFFLDKYNNDKEKLHTLVNHDKLPESASSPYIISYSKGIKLKLKRKNSYAIHHDSKKSLRPDMRVYHAKGFDDY